MGTTPARRVRRHAPPARSVAALLIATLLWAPSVARGAVSPNDEAAAGWLRPVDGAVVAPFDEPVHQYAAGHRGVDFAAAPGTPVRAANDGIVRFAGAVAGSLHVVVGHAGNLRTSSSFLASVAVHQGQAVRRGDVLGMSGGAGPDHGASVLHYGLRIGDRYVDPLQLFRPTDLTALVHLAPTEDPHEGSWSAATEARDLQQSLQLPVPGAATTTGADEGGGCGDGVPIVGGALDAACDLGGWVGSGADDALGAGLDVLDGLTGVADSVLDRLRGPLGETLRQLRELPSALARELARTTTGALVIDLVEMGRRFVGTLAAECSTDAPDADGSGGSAHRVMVVAGINSEGNAGDRGPTVDVDVDALGYHEREGEIRYYSYAADGGPYERDDTHGDLLTAAYRLREQLRAMQLEQPGQRGRSARALAGRDRHRALPALLLQAGGCDVAAPRERRHSVVTA